ncbi:MAG: Spermidine/putrescine import ATP-binding protein PotA [Bryobacteraceae bacterium]|nr:Spermidine/putrescine import ATP-binding protein PotA [Bryobacteraceae bacterium]
MDDTVLELRRISKHYPGHRAVDGISLRVPRGALYTLVGPSGCGKTTTLRLIAGFEEPTSGELLLNGSRIEHLRPYQRNLSTVFQNYALFPHLTVRGNIEFGLRRRGDRHIEEPVRRVLELLRIAGKESRYPHQLSGGERQRVALARSLVLAPEVLLLDEPLSALDPQLRKQVRAELKNIQRGVGITFLMVTHDQEEALSVSDHIAVMNGGRLEQTGPPREIYLRPATRFTAGFLGAVNWIGGIGVRPESTRASTDAPPPEARSRQATVQSTTFLGNRYHVEVSFDGGARAVCEVPRNSHLFSPGQDVHLWWREEDEMRFPDQ